MNLKELYYRFKYRPKRGQCGATGIIVRNKVKSRNKYTENDFQNRLEKLIATATPCHKTNAEVLEYLKGKTN